MKKGSIISSASSLPGRGALLPKRSNQRWSHPPSGRVSMIRKSSPIITIHTSTRSIAYAAMRGAGPAIGSDSSTPSGERTVTSSC